MQQEPRRIVTDSMMGLEMPDIARWSPRVQVVLGQNPGPFTGPGTNTYLLGTGESLLLLDTGQGVEGWVDKLHEALAGRQLEAMVLTHGHPDHIGGVAQVLDRYGDMPIHKARCAEYDRDLEISDLADGGRVSVEGVTLRALATPGHAADHLCFVLEEENAVFSGDNVLGAGTTVIPGNGDMAQYLDSLALLLDISPDVIYPAHGPAITDPARKVGELIAHRNLRERQVLACLGDKPMAVEAIVELMYTDVPVSLHPAAAWSVAAHLRKLESEGSARGGEQGWALAPGPG